ncbi:MAG: sodium:alanine symporter family protein [Desulfobacterium sp.]|nr:sodium:alanine symporter family protein [Desulfobacterium sp.]
MTGFLSQLSSFVWGLPLIILLIGTGLFLTIRLKGIQFSGFREGLKVLRGVYDNPDDPGEISHFRALSTALSATIGTGNIIGVSVAVLAGGPGAVFWMWITACVGMATKFTSCTLAVHFRKIDQDGEAHGGPMHFIEIGMGSSYKWLAVCFAVFTALASFGIGNMFQINSMVSAVNTLLFKEVVEPGIALRLVVGVFTAAIVASVILGGIKRIAHVAGVLVPFMCAVYIGTGIVILVKNAHLILPGLQLIFEQAFHAPESVSGGLLGGVIRSGVARGLFSNEAGLGSAPIAHGAARTKEPVREGLVAMLGPFIDTLMVCSITGLVVVCMKTYETVQVKGILTSVAFDQGLSGAGYIVSFSVILFAFTTLIGWSYYGDRAVDYLFGKSYVPVYKWIYVGFVIIGALNPLEDVINLCDALNGLMAIPNLIALIVLAPLVADLTRKYMIRVKSSGK